MTNLITKVMHNGTQYDIGGVTSVNGQTGAVTVEEGITKIFTLASTSDLTTAQEAYDWIVNGGNAMIILTGTGYVFQLFKKTTTSVAFTAVENFGANNLPLRLYVGGISFTISSGTVTGITNEGNSIRVSSTVPTSGSNSTITYII